MSTIALYRPAVPAGTPSPAAGVLARGSAALERLAAWADRQPAQHRQGRWTLALAAAAWRQPGVR
jgi:hypothetical protein